MRTSILILTAGLALAGCAQIGTASRASSPQCDSRQVVTAFYDKALVQLQPRAAFGQYASAAFVEHKPEVPQGTRDATAAFLEQLIAGMPQPRWEIVRTIAEGDMVFLHARFSPAAGAPAYAIADVFRVHDCLIVEHWDVVAGPVDSAVNPNSRF